jgi:hypothetical protein
MVRMFLSKEICLTINSIKIMENKKKELSLKCKELTHDILGDGDFLTADAAGHYIKNFLGGLGDPTGKGHNFGYLFGLDNVSSFINQINDYNDNADDDAQVEGVRVYLGRQNPMVAGGPVIPRESIMDTVFLIPVKSDGTDLYTVAPIAGNPIILGDPRPCPNECLAALSFYKK